MTPIFYKFFLSLQTFLDNKERTPVELDILKMTIIFTIYTVLTPILSFMFLCTFQFLNLVFDN